MCKRAQQLNNYHKKDLINKTFCKGMEGYNTTLLQKYIWKQNVPINNPLHIFFFFLCEDNGNKFMQLK